MQLRMRSAHPFGRRAAPPGYPASGPPRWYHLPAVHPGGGHRLRFPTPAVPSSRVRSSWPPGVPPDRLGGSAGQHHGSLARDSGGVWSGSDLYLHRSGDLRAIPLADALPGRSAGEFRLEPPVSLWLTEHHRGRIQLLRRPGSNRPRFKQRRVEDRYGARYRTQRPDRGVGNQPCQRLSSTAHDRLSSVPAIAAPGLWLSTTGVQKRCVLPEAAGWRFDPGPTGLSPWP